MKHGEVARWDKIMLTEIGMQFFSRVTFLASTPVYFYVIYTPRGKCCRVFFVVAVAPVPRPGANWMATWVASSLADTRIEAKFQTQTVNVIDNWHKAIWEACWVGHNVSVRRTIWGSPAIIHCDTRTCRINFHLLCNRHSVQGTRDRRRMSRRGGETSCTVYVLPSDGGHAVGFHRLSHRHDLGSVADVVVRIWMRLERLGTVAVCAPGVPACGETPRHGE